MFTPFFRLRLPFFLVWSPRIFFWVPQKRYPKAAPVRPVAELDSLTNPPKGPPLRRSFFFSSLSSSDQGLVIPITLRPGPKD